MKIILIAKITVLGLFALFQLMKMTTYKTETQKYKVVREEKDFEIRFYPSVTMAMISSSAKSYKELGNLGFRKLANYIFGENSTKEKIAMTSPVHLNIDGAVSSMSFVMPTQYNKENLPQPNDASVSIKTTSDEYVAAIKFGGFASDKDIQLYTEKLENALKANSVPYYGNFRLLGYNSPYQLFGRKNEIIVSVTWESKEILKVYE